MCFRSDRHLHLPILETKGGRCRKLPGEFKAAVVSAVRKDEDVKDPRQLVAGARIWGRKRKVPCSSSVRNWEWDSMFRYMSTGLSTMARSGPICVSVDGVWLSKEDTEFVNFLDPRSQANLWAPAQVPS